MIARLRTLLPLTLLLASTSAPLAHADDTSTLEERMSYKDFTRLGLDKLSQDQLRGLNDWFNAHGLSCPPAAATGANPTGAAPATAAAAPPGRTTSRLVGDFTGWEKGTVLTLANGQRWEIRDDEPLVASHEPSPEVTVEKGLFGWRLSVAGHAELAHVIPAGN